MVFAAVKRSTTNPDTLGAAGGGVLRDASRAVLAPATMPQNVRHGVINTPARCCTG
jgi:hypothetical protein